MFLKIFNVKLFFKLLILSSSLSDSYVSIIIYLNILEKYSNDHWYILSIKDKLYIEKKRTLAL